MAFMKVAQGILNLSATYRWQAPFAAAKLTPFLARNDLQRARRVLGVGCRAGHQRTSLCTRGLSGRRHQPGLHRLCPEEVPAAVRGRGREHLRSSAGPALRLSSCSTASFTISRPRLCGASWRTCAHFSRPIVTSISSTSFCPSAVRSPCCSPDSTAATTPDPSANGIGCLANTSALSFSSPIR